MIKVYQETIVDCFPACVASIFEVPIDKPPKINPEYAAGGEFPEEFQRWLQKLRKEFLFPRGLDIYTLYNPNRPRMPWVPGYYVAIAENGVGGYHAVVCRNNRIVHDPSKHKGKIRSKDVKFFVIFIAPFTKKLPRRKLV